MPSRNGIIVMLEKYDRLVDRCRPYAVLNQQIQPFCDLSPFGLNVDEDLLFSPFDRGSHQFLSALQWLDRMTFGFSGMEMPRWVFYDCSEMPGGICGFTIPREELPQFILSGSEAIDSYEGPLPVSMAIAIPMIPAGCWLKHTLCSVNELVEEAAPAGLRTLTLAMALKLFRVRTLYTTTQWRSSELRVHTKFGELELLTAYTPAHSEARTLTYRFNVSDESIKRALSGKDAYSDPPSGVSYFDADNVDGMTDLQRKIENGERYFVCGRAVRDGSTTWIPLRKAN